MTNNETVYTLNLTEQSLAVLKVALEEYEGWAQKEGYLDLTWIAGNILDELYNA